MGRFDNKVVIISGAARGMGKECAQAFAREGARVVLLDTDTEALQAAADDVQSITEHHLTITCNVARSDDVDRALASTLDKFGTVDILVNNAGILRTTSPLETVSEDEWDQVIDVNLKGVFLLTKAVLPIMRQKQYGKIVNISSSAGRSTSELGGAHYTVSKAGVLGLTRHTAREYGRHGINVNSICPGLVDTPMTRKLLDENLDHWLAQIPLGRFAEASEEAALVMFLSSDDARYITGATIDFNGGSLLI